jgi:hypothetical protein
MKFPQNIKQQITLPLIILFSFLIFVFLVIGGFGILILAESNPSIVVQGEDSIVELFINDRVRTVAISGEKSIAKVSYLRNLILVQQNKPMNFLTHALTNDEIRNAFIRSPAVYMDLEKIENKQLLCEELKKSKIPFIGGYEKENSKNFLTKCRPIIDLVDYEEISNFLPFAVFFSILAVNFIFFGFIILFSIKVVSDRRLVALEKEVEGISLQWFEPRGMKLKLNAKLNPPTIEFQSIQQSMNFTPQYYSNQYSYQSQQVGLSTGMYYTTQIL